MYPAHKKGLNAFIYFFVLIILLSIVVIPGLLIGFMTSFDSSLTALIINSIALIFFIFNLSLGNYLEKKFRKLKGQDYLDILNETKNEVVNVLDVRRKIIRSYKLSLAYSILSYILLTLSTFFWITNLKYFGIDEPTALQILPLIIGMVNVGFFLGALFNISGQITASFNKNNTASNYEVFNSLVQEVLFEEGINEPFTTQVVYGTNCSIAQIDKKIHIEIGTYLLAVLSKDEVKSILYHELAHYKQKDTLYSSIVYRYSNLLSILSGEHLYKLTCPFKPILIGKSEISNFLVSLHFENLADDYVLEKDVATDYINANIKIFGLTKSEFIRNSDVIYQVFKQNAWTEELIDAYYQSKIDFYNKHIEVFKMASDKHLKLTYTSHPNIKERKEKFGIKDINIEVKLSDYFKKDLINFYNEINNYGFSNPDNTYFINRYDEYLNLKKAYEETNFENDITQQNNLLYYAFDYGNYELSKTLASNVLAVYPNKEKELFILGATLLNYDFNEEGITYLNKLIEIGDSTHALPAMTTLGDYYVMTGNEEGRTRIKEIQIGLVDNNMELDQLLTLNLNDKLTPFENTEVIDTIIKLVNKNESILQVSMGVKTIKNKTCVHVIVFPTKSFSEKDIDKTMNDIFLYLDALDGQYNLLCLNILVFNRTHQLLKAPFIKYKNHLHQS